MKPLLFMLGVFAATAAFGSRAQAQNYPWCAQYGNGFGGTNCGFTTREQCMATVFGIGGDCEQNLQYRPPPGPHPRYQGKHRSRNHS
jgi:hypothetical protein